MAHDKVCFVISPIGEPESETRKRSDQVLKHVVRPAVSACGYKAVRADEIDKPGMITSQVIQHVVTDPLVIADLTERNPNVFYELAIRHALRKPLVQIIKKGETIPFDVAGTRTIHVDHRDLDSVELAKGEIVEQIKALERDSSDIEPPISVSLDLQLLRQSEKPEERSLADLVAAMSDLRTIVGKLEAKVGTQDQQGAALEKVESELRSRLDDLLEGPRPWGFRRGRFHPMMLREITHMFPSQSEATGILVVASLFRDWMPWLYELGLETYREVRRGGENVHEMLAEFRRAVEVSLHGPLSREFLGRGGKEVFMLSEEIEPLLGRIMHNIEVEIKPAKKKLAKHATPGDGGE